MLIRLAWAAKPLPAGTGIFIALVLSLCGVPDEVVAHEYSLTDIGLLERREKIITYLTPKLGDRPRAEMMVTSKYVVFHALFL